MKILKEILWLLIALILMVMVITPITNIIDYKYLNVNILIIFLAVLYAKFVLEFNYYTFFNNKWVKLFSFTFNLVVLVIIVTIVQQNLIYFDSFTITTYVNSVAILKPTEENHLIKYINTEFLIFGIIAIVSIIVLELKILKSLWSKLSIKDY